MLGDYTRQTDMYIFYVRQIADFNMPFSWYASAKVF